MCIRSKRLQVPLVHMSYLCFVCIDFVDITQYSSGIVGAISFGRLKFIY